MKVLIILLALIVAEATLPGCTHDLKKDCHCENGPCPEGQVCIRGRGDRPNRCQMEIKVINIY
uniref:Decorsin variant 4 n=1 Tax=Macrobdella decora TaxID=6405 RepID=A0A482JSK7_MACDE|nr:decorsin variant 4 [Macrobdella decora]